MLTTSLVRVSVLSGMWKRRWNASAREIAAEDERVHALAAVDRRRQPVFAPARFPALLGQHLQVLQVVPS
jgi:hypothetical protein